MSITACFNLLEKHFEAVTRVYNLNLKISVTVLRLREGALTGHMKKKKKNVPSRRDLNSNVIFISDILVFLCL